MNIQKNIPLAQYTTFKTGGPADFFCEVNTKNDLVECFEWIKNNKKDFYILGGGSNLLINDLGFRGIVIKISNTNISWEGSRSAVGAGTSLISLINEAKKNNLGGLEWAFGIPASLGGAVRNNAGAFGYDMAGVVKAVTIFDANKEEFFSIPQNRCDFTYHKSVFHNNPGWILWEIEISWENSDGKTIQKNIANFVERRKADQPLEFPSAGSFFRNPQLSRLSDVRQEGLIKSFVENELDKSHDDQKKKGIEKEIRNKINKNNLIPAGFLIESAMLKGKTIGGAQVSNKHANFIINTGNAKTEDVVILASIIKQKVRTKFAIQLHEEVEYVGF